MYGSPNKKPFGGVLAPIQAEFYCGMFYDVFLVVGADYLLDAYKKSKDELISLGLISSRVTIVVENQFKALLFECLESGVWYIVWEWKNKYYLGRVQYHLQSWLTRGKEFFPDSIYCTVFKRL